MKKRYVFAVAAVMTIAVVVSGAYCAEAKKELSFDEKYKEHDIVFLDYDINVELHDDWSYTTKEHKTIRVQKEGGKSMGDIPLTYDASREAVTEVRAFTRAPDGNKLSPSKIQDIRRYEGYSMYSDDMVKLVHMPAVTIGSIIDIQVTTETKREVVKDQFWHMLDFNATIPMKEMTYTVTIPKKSAVQYKEFNLKYKPEIKDNGSTITYRWHVDDVYRKPDDEQFVPPLTVETYENGVEFSSIKSWKDISTWFYGLVEKNGTPGQEIKDAVRTAIAGKTTPKDKVRAIIEYVQNDFRYVSMSFGDHALEPHPVDEVFRNKYGDCKDLSLLCRAMLAEAGIRSNLTLFNTEDDITDPQFDLPIPTLFDHVLLEVEDPAGNYYVDPLLKGYDMGEYDPSYQGAYTFIISKDGGRFGRFSVFSEKSDYNKMDRAAVIREDGSEVVEMKGLWDLNNSVATRLIWKEATQEDKNKFYQSFATALTEGGKMLEHRMEGIDASYGPITDHLKYERPNAYPVTGGIMIIGINGFDRGDLFYAKDRRNPIFYPANSITERTYVFDIPKGFTAMYVPQDVNLDIGFYSFNRTFKKTGSRISYTETERYRRMLYPKEDYQKVRDFLDIATRDTSQRIILKTEGGIKKCLEATRI